jgi:flagellar FliJ protein
MEAFKFRLEKILQYRENIAKESEKRLAYKAQQCEKLYQQLKAIENERRTSFMIHGSSRELATMQQAALRHEGLRFQAAKIKTELEYLEKEKEVLRRDYVSKLKDQKVILSLKEKKYQQYKVEKQRYDERVVDDIISTRYIRTHNPH